MTEHGASRGLSAAALIAILATSMSAGAGGRCGDADECLRSMRDSIARRGWLGIEYEEEGERGLPEIVEVLEDSPAAKGGLQQGDLLLAINGVRCDGPRQEVYSEWKKALIPGGELELIVDRKGREVPLTMVAGRVPDSVAAQWVGRHMLEYHLDDEAESPKKESDERG